LTNVYDVLMALAYTTPLLAAAVSLAYAHVYADRKKLATVLAELATAQQQLATDAADIRELRQNVDKIIERRL
jgi:hypothetical protein